ncbi:MAG: CRTAC1 family protein, partial [Acidobacteriota bacterium]
AAVLAERVELREVSDTTPVLAQFVATTQARVAARTAGVVADNSWGVNFFDADLDGLEDLFVSIIVNAASEFFYRNDGVTDGVPRFTNVAVSAGIETADTRASAAADYDRDGDVDFAVINQRGPLQLFRNDTTTDGHWLALELEGRASSRDAIGTVVEATTGSITRRRQVKGGSSAHSQDALTVHFGLGDATVVDRLVVRWPSGDETVLDDVGVDRYLRIVEPLTFRDGFDSGTTHRWSTSFGQRSAATDRRPAPGFDRR